MQLELSQEIDNLGVAAAFRVCRLKIKFEFLNSAAILDYCLTKVSLELCERIKGF
jgi:hypothetical protein